VDAGKSLISTRRPHEGVAVLAVHVPEISQAEMIERLGRDLRLALDAAEASAFVLDLSEVRFLTSAALGMILNLRAHLAERDLRLALAAATGEVARTLACARLAEIMPVCATVQEAAAALRAC
jgi:anti-anti-sigma factor